MKKKLYALSLTTALLLSLAACGQTNNENTEANTPIPTKEAVPTVEPTVTPTVMPTELPTATPTKAAKPTAAPTETPAPVAKTITPLPVTIDMSNLTDCTIAVSFDKGDAYVDDTGKMQLKVKVYTYDLYDMVDIALLAPGDTIILRNEEVLITSLVRTDYGAVQINGGLDMGGYELITTDNTVYFETGYSDVKTWFELGEITLPVSADFIFTDSFDLDKGEITYYPGDLLSDEAGIYYSFSPYNTSIVIEGGIITQMKRVYTP